MKKKKYRGFTLIEMLIVLFIISILLLLIVPQLTSRKDSIVKQGDAAFTEVLRTQVHLYEMDTNNKLSTWDELSSYLNKDQIEKAKTLYPNIDDLDK